MANAQAVEIMAVYCGKRCKAWREQVRAELEQATKCSVTTTFIIKTGPRQYDIRFQIYNESNRHTIMPNWFGTACCPAAAEAMAYQEYLNENI